MIGRNTLPLIYVAGYGRWYKGSSLRQSHQIKSTCQPYPPSGSRLCLCNHTQAQFTLGQKSYFSCFEHYEFAVLEVPPRRAVGLPFQTNCPARDVFSESVNTLEWGASTKTTFPLPTLSLDCSCVVLVRAPQRRRAVGMCTHVQNIVVCLLRTRWERDTEGEGLKEGWQVCRAGQHFSLQAEFPALWETRFCSRHLNWSDEAHHIMVEKLLYSKSAEHVYKTPTQQPREGLLRQHWWWPSQFRSWLSDKCGAGSGGSSSPE